MNEMVNIVPLGSCPKCGHKQFVVSEHQINEYLTNQDGNVIDCSDVIYDAKGICLNCKTIFKMYPTRDGFIPLTRLREIILDYTPHTQIVKEEKIADIPNPMEVKNGRNI